MTVLFTKWHRHWNKYICKFQWEANANQNSSAFKIKLVWWIKSLLFVSLSLMLSSFFPFELLVQCLRGVLFMLRENGKISVVRYASLYPSRKVWQIEKKSTPRWLHGWFYQNGAMCMDIFLLTLVECPKHRNGIVLCPPNQHSCAIWWILPILYENRVVPPWHLTSRPFFRSVNVVIPSTFITFRLT